MKARTEPRRRSRNAIDPPDLLIELAAGRHPEAREFALADFPFAVDHRMTGLLWTWAQEHLQDRELRTHLAMYDLGVRAQLDRIRKVLESSVARLEAAGIEVATIKGVTSEARWYARPGERPCADVDLLLAPHQLDRATEAVAILHPGHPWIPHLESLLKTRRVQAVTLHVDHMDVDLHFDLLKLGIPTRGEAQIWTRTSLYELPSGARVRVLDDTSALLHFLVHLNKDRFQRLLGYADISRVMAAGQVDWDLLLSDARREGIEVAVLRTLGTVLDRLSLPWPRALARPQGPRSLIWGWVWRPAIHLRGEEGRLKFRMRQNWIAILARGRALEAFVWWLRELWPPTAAVEVRYAGVRGPYLWKLLRGRFAATLAHRRHLADVRRSKAEHSH